MQIFFRTPFWSSLESSLSSCVLLLTFYLPYHGLLIQTTLGSSFPTRSEYKLGAKAVPRRCLRNTFF